MVGLYARHHAARPRRCLNNSCGFTLRLRAILHVALLGRRLEERIRGARQADCGCGMLLVLRCGGDVGEGGHVAREQLVQIPLADDGDRAAL